MNADFEYGPIERPSDDIARVEVRVPADLRYFDGHFPGDPIIPGVAQVVCLVEEQARRAFPGLGPTRGLSRVKFLQALRPGDVLSVVLTRRSDGSVAFEIHRAEKRCSKGRLVCSPGPGAS